MRRQFRGRTEASVASSEGEQGFWPSYADMMSAVALILFFLMLLSYIQNLITGNDLQNTQELLAETTQQVDDAQAQLSQLQLDLDDAEKTLTGQQKQIATQQALIDDQEDYLAAANEELLEMRGQMQTIAVLRLSILEKIKDSIIAATGDENMVSIGQSGNIILNEGVLFDLGSYAIKNDSAPMLRQLATVFSTFLADGENAKYVDSIVISGHTDTTGSDEENLKLSLERANSVLRYLLSANGGALNGYSKYFCASGYGETRPVASNDTTEGQATNRRIEISIILKDETVLDIVEQYLQLEVPTASPAPSPLG